MATWPGQETFLRIFLRNEEEVQKWTSIMEASKELGDVDATVRKNNHPACVLEKQLQLPRKT